ncbi:MAG TPA: hypothetical protein VJ728_00670, partial [Candidatus Binataceae bacterium]|nr:hypothetical protein [Candidatus Binataceae bacterium]
RLVLTSTLWKEPLAGNSRTGERIISDSLGGHRNCNLYNGRYRPCSGDFKGNGWDCGNCSFVRQGTDSTSNLAWPNSSDYSSKQFVPG